MSQSSMKAPVLDRDLLESVAALPISANEFHQIAYYLPLAVRQSEVAEPDLVCVIAPSLVGYSVVSPEGAWRPTYMPVSVRCLPLALSTTSGPSGDASRQVVRLSSEGAAVPYEPQPTDAAWALAAASRGKLLGQVEASQRVLRHALDMLCLSGILSPLLLPDDRHASIGLLTVDGGRFAKLSRAQLSALSRESFMALDILGALLQSRRRLAGRLRLPGEDGFNPIVQMANLMPRELPDHAPPMLETSGVWLDDSETFG